MAILGTSSQVAFAQKKKKKKKKGEQVLAEIGPRQKAQIDNLFVEAATQRMLGDIDKALLHYNSILKIDPSHHATRYEKARILAEKGDMGTAITEAQIALKATPENYWYHVLVQRIFMEQGQYKEAIDVGKGIVSKFSSRPNPRATLASLYSRTEQPNQAYEQWEFLAQKSGWQDSAYAQMYAIRTVDNAPSKGLLVAQAWVTARPQSHAAHEALVTTLQASGDKAATQRALENWAQIQGAPGKARIMLADKESSPSAKAQVYQDVFAASDVSLEDKLAAWDQIWSTGDETTLAKQLLTVLENNYPGESSLRYRQGLVLSKEGNYIAAAKSLRDALRTGNEGPDAWIDLFSLDLEGADFQMLKQDVEEARELYPNSRDLLAYGGIAYIQTNDIEGAVYVLKKLGKMSETVTPTEQAAWAYYHFSKNLTVEPPKTAVPFLESIDKIFAEIAEQKNVKEALSLLDEKVKRIPLLQYAPHIWTYKGHGLKALGKTESATQAWTKARTLGAASPESDL